MSSGSGESSDVSAGETVKWSSGDGDTDNDSMGLIVSVMVVDGRCQSERGGKGLSMQSSQGHVVITNRHRRSQIRGRCESAREKDTCSLG